MEHCWRGKPVADSILKTAANNSEALRRRGITPKLGIVRVGARSDDLLYEKGIARACKKGGVAMKVFPFADNISEEGFCNELSKIVTMDDLQGILVFFPLPRHISEARVREMIPTEKDIDCLSPQSACGVYCGSDNAFPPCTPQAVMEMLHYYGVSLEGKDVTIIGRSLVVGKPLSMLLLKENATITLCHSRTKDLRKKTGESQILVAALGKPRFVNRDFVSPGQIVIDVGIHEVDGIYCGDVDYDSVEPLAAAISPAPGGVGSITSAVLVKHTIDACMKKEA